jgi:endonuclease/exonuclease/phosphatase family metal-dependent hydrolase
MPPFTAMTFNIRTSLAKDGPNDWALRKDLAVQHILANDPDLLGIQEPSTAQWEDLTRALGGRWTGVAYDKQDGGKPQGHLQGLFFRTDRYRLDGQGVFWLSSTPAVPGSISFPQDWGARIALWVRLNDRQAGRDLLFVCVHLDTHGGSWIPELEVVISEVNRHGGALPVVVLGDFNCAAGSAPWRLLTETGGFADTWHDAGLSDEGMVSFNAFTPVTKLPLDNMPFLAKWLHDQCDHVPQFAHYPQHVLDHRNYRIDWIMRRGPLRTLGAKIDTTTWNGRTSSDHYPVIASLEWK